MRPLDRANLLTLTLAIVVGTGTLHEASGSESSVRQHSNVIRLTLRSADSLQVLVGTPSSIYTDHIDIVADSASVPISIDRGQVERIQIRRQSTRAALGALLGTVVGAALGVALAPEDSKDTSSGSGFDFDFYAGSRFTGFVAGALGGAFVGGVLGKRVKTRVYWEETDVTIFWPKPTSPGYSSLHGGYTSPGEAGIGTTAYMRLSRRLHLGAELSYYRLGRDDPDLRANVMMRIGMLGDRTRAFASLGLGAIEAADLCAGAGLLIPTRIWAGSLRLESRWLKSDDSDSIEIAMGLRFVEW